MVATSNNRKRYYVWGIAGMLIIAGIVTTVVVMIEKNRNAGGLNGSSNAGQIGVETPSGTNSPAIPPSNGPSNSSSKPSATPTTSAISADSSSTSASASPTSTPTGGACSNPRVRKSWKESTDAERSAFLNAVLALKKAPSINGHSSRYEDFVIVHDNAKTIAHSTVSFHGSLTPIGNVFAMAPSFHD